MEQYWRVYPTKRVTGYTHTYIKADGLNGLQRAAQEAIRMKRLTGIEWKAELVTK